jgi:phosphate-selective porin OprO/OprP
VETNLPPPVAGTNAPAPKEKSFHWQSTWEGWNGLHLELSQKSLIQGPFAELQARLSGTNARPVFHLEELKMTGKIGAKLAVDAAAYVTGSEFTGFDPGIELRRARIYGKGDCLLLLPVSYELEIGYIPNEFYIENSYLSFKNIPWIGELKGGQFQPPMGLEMITSSRDITFMEPAAPMQALAPGVSAGTQIGRPVLNQRATWRFGLFTGGVKNDYGDASRDYGRAIMRFSGLPLWDPGETPRLLHLGLSANILYSASSNVRYRSRPESHLAPYVIDTGNISAEGALVTGGEIAWVNGPFSVQGEFLHSWVRENDGQVPQFYGFYASTSWFLTGESRPYNRDKGDFARVIPKRNFAFRNGGWGAWEVGARFSYTDLNDGDVQGGRLAMLMTGVNWYLHSHVKWRFDYGFGHVSGRTPEGNINIFQTRVEVDL